MNFGDKRLRQRSSMYRYMKQRGIRVLISREAMKILFGVSREGALSFECSRRIQRGIGYIRHSLDTHSYMTIVISYRGGRNVRN